MLGFSASAQTSSPLEPIYACASISDDNERLACYDAAVGRAQQAEKQGEFKTITRQEAEDVQKDAFGFSLPSLPKFNLPSLGRGDDTIKKDKEGQIEEVSLEIDRVTRDGYDKLIVRFKNGQVWRQTESGKIMVSTKRPPTSAIIKRAAFGSFLIKLNTGERFKAKREE